MPTHSGKMRTFKTKDGKTVSFKAGEKVKFTIKKKQEEPKAKPKAKPKKQEPKEPEMFDDLDSEENLEIPAFLRRQKN